MTFDRYFPTWQKSFHNSIRSAPVFLHLCRSENNPLHFPKAIPHNGARRFGARFWPKRKYGKCGNTGCISHFSYCTIGAKDPPKPAAPIVRCCPKKCRGYFPGWKSWNPAISGLFVKKVWWLIHCAKSQGMHHLPEAIQPEKSHRVLLQIPAQCFSWIVVSRFPLRSNGWTDSCSVSGALRSFCI